MMPFSDLRSSLIFHLLYDSSQRDDTGEISQYSREAQEVAAAAHEQDVWVLEPCSSPSAPHRFLARGWRVHLQDWPSPLLLALCASKDIWQQEKNLFYSRISAIIQSASGLWLSLPRMLVTPEGISFLKVKDLLSHFQK